MGTKLLSRVILILLSTLNAQLSAAPLGTAFSYQGRLQSGGMPANGQYDILLSLHLSSGGGEAVATVTNFNVKVSNGLFTTTVDFAPGVFTSGNAFWLGIGVRTNSSMDDFSILAPRQPLTPAPYAQYAPIADYASTAGTALTAAQAHSVFNRAIAANQLNTSATPAAGEVLGYDGSSLVWTNANGAAAELIIQGPGTTNSPSDWTNVVRAVVSETVGAGGARFSGDGAGLTNVNGVLNVKAFGAKGDGESDDTGAIQGAMDALQSWSQPNTTLYFPAGTYVLSQPISLLPTVGSEANQVLAVHAGAHLKGAGATITRLRWAAPYSGQGLVLTNVFYQGIIIEDLMFEGPMSRESGGDSSVGMVFGGLHSSHYGNNITVRNCAIHGWGTGLSATHLWMFKVQNCMVVSNYLEGLHFSGSHGVSVQDTWICGAWGDGRMATGNGIGFHVPPDAGYGDNAEVLNCQISYCTNAVFNEELMLNIFGGNWEDCGCYLNLGGVSLNTVKGLYVLDQPHDWNSGFAALVRIDNADAPVSERTSFENCYLSGNAGRRAFSVLDSTPSSGFLLPHLIGGGELLGLWGTSSNVTVTAWSSVAGNSGMLTNNGVVWLSTNNTPGASTVLPAGSIATVSGGSNPGLYVQAVPGTWVGPK